MVGPSIDSQQDAQHACFGPRGLAGRPFFGIFSLVARCLVKRTQKELFSRLQRRVDKIERQGTWALDTTGEGGCLDQSNAGKLFIDFFLGDESSNIMGKMGEFANRNGAKLSLP